MRRKFSSAQPRPHQSLEQRFSAPGLNMRDPTKMYSTGLSMFLYNEGRKWFTIISTFITPVLLVINAPFGRFTPKNQTGIFVVDGLKSWIVMELVAPLTFIYTFVASPLTAQTPPLPSITQPHAFLATCFCIHYANRAIINPLRTSSRSKTHVIVLFCGIIFNIINGSLMGSYLSSPYARIYLSTPRPSFYIGLGIWALGMVGNIWHDEILLNIRRKAKAKGKGKAGNGTNGEHYAIPRGGLYSLVSYPNYLCEWIEWLGFAIAASPIPFQLTGLTAGTVASTLLDPQAYLTILKTPAHSFAPNLAPPWIFLFSEVVLMLPRAYRGHGWYHEKFGDAYPKKRKAAIPFIL